MLRIIKYHTQCQVVDLSIAFDRTLSARLSLSSWTNGWFWLIDCEIKHHSKCKTYWGIRIYYWLRTKIWPTLSSYKNEIKADLTFFIRCSNKTSRRTLLIIVNSWFVPKLLYGIEFVSMSNNNIGKKLAPTHYCVLKKITGAFITSPGSIKLPDNASIFSSRDCLTVCWGSHLKWQRASYLYG